MHNKQAFMMKTSENNTAFNDSQIDPNLKNTVWQ